MNARITIYPNIQYLYIEQVRTWNVYSTYIIIADMHSLAFSLQRKSYSGVFYHWQRVQGTQQKQKKTFWSIKSYQQIGNVSRQLNMVLLKQLKYYLNTTQQHAIKFLEQLKDIFFVWRLQHGHRQQKDAFRLSYFRSSLVLIVLIG